MPPGNLYPRIEGMPGKAGTYRLTEDILDDLHEARMLGNDSIHDALEYSADEVADVAELIVDAVHEAYVVPAKRTAMKQARAARRAKKSTS